MRYREYFGRELRRASVSGLLLTENTYAPQTNLPKHQHANAYFMLVLNGGLTESTTSTEFECGSSSLLFHREGSVHTNRFGSGAARCFGIEFDSAFLRRLDWSENNDAAGTWVIRSPATVSLAYKLRKELLQGDPVSPVVIEGLALTLLGETERSMRSQLLERRKIPRWLQAANEMVHEQAQHPLTVTGVADFVGVHPVTLARTYRKVFGKTVGEAMRERRLQHGMRLLADTELPITTIALTSGFADHSHFSRAFRQQFGMTPQQFRRTRAGCDPAVS
jgi:AraC family transcriptional regulator